MVSTFRGPGPSTSQDYPNSTPTPATTTTREGQRRGPSLRDISQQELNTATQYMIDELMSQGMSEAEAIEYLGCCCKAGRRAAKTQFLIL